MQPAPSRHGWVMVLTLAKELNNEPISSAKECQIVQPVHAPYLVQKYESSLERGFVVVSGLEEHVAASSISSSTAMAVDREQNYFSFTMLDVSSRVEDYTEMKDDKFQQLDSSDSAIVLI